MAQETNIMALLAEAAIFDSLAEEAHAAIAREMRPMTYSAGQLIFSRGDDRQELYLVIDGRVRLSILSAEGRELSFAHAGTGAVFGEIAMLDGKARTADATAVGKVQAMVLSHTAFRRLLEDTPGLADAVIRFLCARIREADLQLEGVALHRIEVRLARYLLSRCMQYAPDQEDGEVMIDIGMSQGELALLLGASRPKVNGALMLLEDQGVLTRDGNKVRCDLDELRSIAEMD